jgi:photosystem II stability/assembly factor-like uncharacterized protein
MPRLKLLTCAAGALMSVSMFAARSTMSAQSAGASAGQAGALTPALLSELTWRGIGPAITSGRIVDIAVPEGAANANTTTFYVASASGGLWKTTNGGTTFEPIFDNQSSMSIGDVAVAPSNPEIVWVGTGEANNQRSSSWGDGIYKSVNGGKTWSPMGLKNSQHIGRIVIHPANADVVFVAALGPLWGAGGERGIFKTTDGGTTWKNTKSIGDHTGFVDLVMDPKNPDVLYAAAYQRERRAYSFLGGGPESGIFKSSDGGGNWRKLTEGLPQGDIGRIGLTVSASDPATLYANVQARDGGVFRSDDYGESWRRTNTQNNTPWYYSQIRVDPKDPERVYTLAVNCSVSEDGGKTFRGDVARTTHVDHHALWIDPADTNHLLLGNDGGLYTSRDRGKTWDFAANLPVAQFYAIAVDMREPFYHVYGGTQDNRSWGAPSATRNRAGITNADWYQTVGGDGFYSAIDYSDPNIAYAESQEGGVIRYDVRSGERKSIKPQPAPGKPPYRFNWSAPILVSPHDPKTIYFAANVVFKSPDRGDTWMTLGGDLTRQRNRDSLPMMGKVWDRTAISRHEGTAQYGNISSFDESPIKKGLLYAGTDDGLVQASKDGGATWTNVEKFPGVPDETYVSRVTASPLQEGTVFATFDGHRSNDFKPYVLKSTDYGATWTSIAANLPASGSAYVIRQHPRNGALLFVGTEFGVFVSIDGGGAWTPIKNNLPTVAVHDLIIHPRENDVIIGTHGRGIYILDDITPLEKLTAAALASESQLFPPRSALLFNQADPYGGGPRGVGDQGDRLFAAPNPAAGATVSYYLKQDLPRDRDAKLTIVDPSGAVVRELDVSKKAGLHRVVWDLRLAPPYVVVRPAGAPADDTAGFFGGGNVRGPYALPGAYKARLNVAGTTGSAQASVLEVPLVVKADPLVQLSDTDYRTLFQARVSASHLQARVQAAVRSADQLKAQIDEAKKAIASASAPAALTKDADAIGKDLDDIIAKVRGSGRGFGGGGGGGGDDEAPPRTPSIQQRVNGVANEIGGVTSLPTAQQRDTLAIAGTDLDIQLERVNALITTLVPAFNKALDEAKVPWSIGRPVK